MGSPTDRRSLRRSHRAAFALVAALLVLFGLASTGLTLPERAAPSVPRGVHEAGAIDGRASPPAVSAPIAVQAIAAAIDGPRVDVPTAVERAQARAHLDADLRRRLRRLPITARGPPGRLIA